MGTGGMAVDSRPGIAKPGRDPEVVAVVDSWLVLVRELGNRLTEGPGTEGRGISPIASTADMLKQRN